MRKALRTIRFDETDSRVFASAATPGEWAISGAFEFANAQPEALIGKTKQAFANGFLGLGSFGRSTFATVSEITDTEWLSCENALVAHFISHYGAPDNTHADASVRIEARAELEFIAELAAAKPINTVLTVRRVHDAKGSAREEFRVITPPTGEPLHTKIWTIVADGDDDDPMRVRS